MVYLGTLETRRDSIDIASMTIFVAGLVRKTLGHNTATENECSYWLETGVSDGEF